MSRTRARFPAVGITEGAEVIIPEVAPPLSAESGAIRIEGWDRHGFLRDVAAVISENRMQLLALSAQANPIRARR